jgi:hypothetical protein
MEIRNIKFKAKRLDNGEWVKGDLVHSTSYVGISYPSDEFSDVPIVHRVDPSTVCQFTGLKDCEGKEVWDHDLLQSPCKETEEIYEVSWGQEEGGFIVKHTVSGGRLLTFLCPALMLFRFKVIGNKFDKKK